MSESRKSEANKLDCDRLATKIGKDSEVHKWLTENANSDPSWRRKRKWTAMGWEVYERKSLLLVAARDLAQNGVKNPLKLAATDIFIETAQRALTFRGTTLYIFGAISALDAVWVLGEAALRVFRLDPLRVLATVSSVRAHTPNEAISRMDGLAN